MVIKTEAGFGERIPTREDMEILIRLKLAGNLSPDVHRKAEDAMTTWLKSFKSLDNA